MDKPNHNDELHVDNELPPPAYELTNAELDRKIADAAQQSLSLTEQAQPPRPTLPPIDEDGFPIWDDALFEYNKAQREREVEAQNSKLQSEYSRPAPQASASSSASSSSSPPPRHAQARPLSAPRQSLPAAPSRAMSPSVSKQKEDRLGWYDENAVGRIGQDVDPNPPMTATQNVGRAPSTRPGIQVQVGPRPHDLLAQPQSPVSDAEDDNGGPGLNRAPTYHPMGSAHPGHARVMNERRQAQGHVQRTNTVTSVRSVDLPPFTEVAESLEGPAYEDIRAASPASRRVPGPGAASPPPNERRQSGTREWKPVQARPQAQERVADVRRSTLASMPGSAGTANVPHPPPRASHSSYVPPARPISTAQYTPGVYSAPVVTRSGDFDPNVAYFPKQSHAQVGRFDSVSGGQKALLEAGASAFYNAAVASTLAKTTVFKAPPPPPQRVMTGAGADDDGMSVFSGRSGGARPASVYSGGQGARMSIYGTPGGGVMAGGAVHPTTSASAAPNPTNYSLATGHYQPGLGSQIPGAGGYQSNLNAQPSYQPGNMQSVTYQPTNQHWNLPPGTMQYHPQQSQSPPGQVQPSHPPQTYQRPLPQPGAFASGGGYAPVSAGGHAGGMQIPGVASQSAGGFVAPPPPPGKKLNKLYKRL